MSDYNIKLLELIGIENRDDKLYFKVNFTFKEDIEMFLEIDDYTVENVRNRLQFNTVYKYRLSFKSFDDNINDQYVAVITKTFRDKSEKIYFNCSEDYINKLNAIKTIEDINELDKLSYILKESPSIDEKLEENDKVNDSKEKSFRFSFVSAALVSMASLLVFGYMGNSYLKKHYCNEGVLAESIQLDFERGQNRQSEPIAYYNFDNHNVLQVLFKEDELEIEDDSIEIPSSVEENTPFIELENTVTYNLPEGMVALTFDDGPSEYTKEIIDILKEYNVGGTFFLVGYNVEQYPDYVNYIHSNGYSVGSHSIRHSDMATLSYEEQESELVNSIEMLKEIVDDDVNLFRPPYGSYNNKLINLANDNEYKIILWNNDPEDWRTRDPDKIFESIKNSATSGAIILLHESQAVIDSLPKVIEYLLEQNLEIVNLK